MKTHVICAVILSICSSARSAILDFEQVLGTAPFEGMIISNQFAGTFGMRFSDFQDTGFPVIIQTGPPGRGFDTSIGPDMIFPTNSTDHGRFFLADPRFDGPLGLTVRFDSPVSTFSCYLLDMDEGERVTLTAYASDAPTSGLATNIFYGTNGLRFGSGLSGLADISTPTKQIHRVTARIQGGGLGIGFDNLSSDYVPPAQTAASLGIQFYPGITITGAVGTLYRIEYADSLDRTPTRTNWHALATIVLPSSPHRYFDTSPANVTTRIYQAVGVQ